MVATPANWNVDTQDLRARAVDVISAEAVRGHVVTAREAACMLSGVAGFIAQHESVSAMQCAAAALARHELAWVTKLGSLPITDGYVDRNVEMFACVCRGMLAMAGVKNLRAALSYWATESDPASWRALVG
jgi:hypothetical protein